MVTSNKRRLRFRAGVPRACISAGLQALADGLGGNGILPSVEAPDDRDPVLDGRLTRVEARLTAHGK